MGAFDSGWTSDFFRFPTLANSRTSSSVKAGSGSNCAADFTGQAITHVANHLAPYFHRKLEEVRSHRAVVGCGFIAALELVPRRGREALTPKMVFEGLVVDPRRGRDRGGFVTSSPLPIL